MKIKQRSSLAKNLQGALPKQAFIFSQKDLQILKCFDAIALAVIGAAGIIADAVVAPNILQIAKHIPKLRRALRKSNEPAKNIARTFYYLKRQKKAGKNEFQ